MDMIHELKKELITNEEVSELSLQSWFEKGLTYEQYVAFMQVNKEELTHIYHELELTDEIKSFLTQFQSKKWRVIVLTADWCGDAMLNVPILQRMAEIGHFPLRLLVRDENLELMDQYLTNETSRSIPIFIWIDEQGDEQLVWGPRAVEVQDWVNELKSQLPPKSDPSFADQQQDMLQKFRTRVTTDQQLWKDVVRSIQKCLSIQLETSAEKGGHYE